MRQFIIGTALSAILVWGLWRDSNPLQAQQDQAEFFALGTLIQIKTTQELSSTLIADMQTQLSEFERHWSVLGNGELVALNQQLAESSIAELADHLKPGFELAKRACLASGGLFDPALGSLVQLWGFEDENSFRQRPPPDIDIKASKDQAPSLCDAELQTQLKLNKAGAQLNFGASAKGRAVDLLLEQLQENGHQQALVNAGGDLKAAGTAANRPWRIGIRNPRPTSNADTVLAKIDVKPGEAVFTSGDYERYFIFGNKRYHHIIDPRSGYPADQSQSATVIHGNAEWADAASTALFVAGPQLAADTMHGMQIDLWLLVDSHGETHASEAMKARLKLLQSEL